MCFGRVCTGICCEHGFRASCGSSTGAFFVAPSGGHPLSALWLYWSLVALFGVLLRRVSKWCNGRFSSDAEHGRPNGPPPFLPFFPSLPHISRNFSYYRSNRVYLSQNQRRVEVIGWCNRSFTVLDLLVWLRVVLVCIQRRCSIE